MSENLVKCDSEAEEEDSIDAKEDGEAVSVKGEGVPCNVEEVDVGEGDEDNREKFSGYATRLITKSGEHIELPHQHWRQNCMHERLTEL